MRAFKIKVSEILTRTVTVTAEDWYDAVERVENMCNDGIIDLGAEDFASREIVRVEEE